MQASGGTESGDRGTTAKDLHKFLNRRIALRSRLVTFHNHLIDNESSSGFGVIELDTMLESISELEGRLQVNQDHVYEVLGNDKTELSHQIDAACEVEATIMSCKVMAKRAKAKLIPLIGEVSNIQKEANPVNPKLPKLELPTFNGSFEDWISFRDQFNSTIGSNPRLSGSDKLQYLKACCKDDAERLITHFSISEANYEPAWSTLAKRYNNEREIVFSLIKRLMNLGKVTSDNPNSLRKMVDSFCQIRKSLEVIERQVDGWDDWLVVSLVEKLDQETKKEWAKSVTGTDMPTFQELEEFLENYIRGMTAFTSTKVKDRTEKRSSHVMGAQTTKCAVCNENHYLNKCKRFQEMLYEEKVCLIKRNKLCFNCFGQGHMADRCSWKGSCRKCGKKHHSLIHREILNNATAEINLNDVVVSANYISNGGVLLGTAIIKIKDVAGSFQECRVLLDSGSEASLVTEACVKKLQLPRNHCGVVVSGVCGKSQKVKGVATLQIYSRLTDFNININALILSKVTGNLPSFNLDNRWKSWKHIVGLQMADPQFFNPREVDIILGADVVEMIYHSHKRIGLKNEPIAKSSEFGWILVGPIGSSVINHHYQSNHVIKVNTTSLVLEKLVQRFWELDSVPYKPNWTTEEKNAEEHFLRTHYKEECGRYVLSYPFKKNLNNLGYSRKIAESRFLSLERKFTKNEEVKTQYTKFVQEYLELGHMELIKPIEEGEVLGVTNYLPHHCVTKGDSTTTKLRVVFDGSCQTSSGMSLNNAMMVGPVVQPDVFTHLLRFRKYNIAIKSDIAKMYRQFRVSYKDSNLQRILWRFNPNDNIQEFRLKTITYGTASAPFLATRCLNMIAEENIDSYPLAASVILKNFYVDDLHVSVQNLEHAIKVQKDLDNILQSAGLYLRKWDSNCSEFLSQLENERKDCNELSNFEESFTSKALGVKWNSKDDVFVFTDYTPELQSVTRRSILSCIAQIFDPLGFLAPHTVMLKIQFQSLWSLCNKQGNQPSWDDPIPTSMLDYWNSLSKEIKKLKLIRIPRVLLPNNCVEIHGFSDASEKAYGAVVYVRSLKDLKCRIVAAKTKVAPLKSQSLPRLELCGAVLLANLVNKIMLALEIDCPIHCWTDSEITLKWISSPSRKFAAFIANRVSQIQENIPVES